MVQTTKYFGTAAAKAGMDEKTARKYLKSSKLPSELKSEHSLRTREDPFCDVWSQVQSKLESSCGGRMKNETGVGRKT